MTDEQKKRAEARINETARAWKAAEAIPGNEGEALKLRNDVWTWADSLFNPNKTEDITDTIISAIFHFDPDKGEFCHYLSFILPLRKKEQAKKASIQAENEISLSTPLSSGDGGAFTLADVILSDTDMEREAESRANTSSLLVEMTSLVLDFYGRHTGHAANEGRRMWYRLFFTEDVTYVCKDEPDLLKHPRDVFQAMDLDYLDYYMSAPCRTPEDVGRTPLKPYCQVVPDSGNESAAWLETSFPGDVSLFYLLKTTGTRPGRSARSNQLRSFRAELSGLL